MGKSYNLKIRDKIFTGGTHVMAILNATPDSFFRASRIEDKCIEKALDAIRAGAEVLDIGGQSTRPGAELVSSIEEMSRVLPVIEAVRAADKDIPISVDTFYPEVAQACLEAGADMINDVSCLSDDNMARLIANFGACACIMHDRRHSKIQDLFADKLFGLRTAVDKLKKAGVPQNKILLDGGIGFNQNRDEDWRLLEGYDKLISAFDEPFLIGTSRKSMFGGDVEDRLPATLESTALAIKKGVLFVRVHDVSENLAVIKAFT